MLITQLKPKEDLLSFISGEKVFILQCYGCAEVFLPKEEINLFLEELNNSGTLIVKNIISDYLCNYEYTKLRINLWAEELKKSEKIVIFSCGIGVQVVSTILNQVSSISHQSPV
ncbi:MAG TPA: 5,10-methylene tetrahydromethanopterin reductase, partial [Elusimicrobia bacterium]|nr:5,10-methylene tetrahydromethanopterin reductase [Elusimicrobiota bacterium]